jgi:quercetin dioxygenase-like cupin family protein
MKQWAGVLAVVAVAALSASGSNAQTARQKLPDAVKADPKHYTVEFENDIVRVLRVKVGAGESAPPHSHDAYCAIEVSDSSLREGNGPVSNSKTGDVFCGDATSHGPTNVGKAVAESIVVEFKNRQKAR